jgi:hypothetical protein
VSDTTAARPNADPHPPVVMISIVDHNRAVLQNPHRYTCRKPPLSIPTCSCVDHWHTSGRVGSYRQVIRAGQEHVFLNSEPGIQLVVGRDGRPRKGTLHIRKAVLNHSLVPVSPPSIVTTSSSGSSDYHPARFLGLFAPVPFWLIWRFSKKDSVLAKSMAYLNIPIIALYVGW